MVGPLVVCIWFAAFATTAAIAIAAAVTDVAVVDVASVSCFCC